MTFYACLTEGFADSVVAWLHSVYVSLLRFPYGNGTLTSRGTKDEHWQCKQPAFCLKTIQNVLFSKAAFNLCRFGKLGLFEFAV